MSEAGTVVEVNPLDGTLLGKMKELVDSCGDDYLAAKSGGVVAASRRVRVKMLEVKKLVLELRKEMLEARPKKEKKPAKKKAAKKKSGKKK